MAVEDKREGWLKDLNVGMRVVVSNRMHDQIGMVTKITPSGKIDVGNVRFDHFGDRVGDSGWDRQRLEQLTPERFKQIRRNSYISRIESMIDYWKRADGGLVDRQNNLDLFDFDELRDIHEKFTNWNKAIVEREQRKGK